MHKVAIHSAPRSGSTWLGNIFNSHPAVTFKVQPLFSYAFKGRLTERSTTAEIAGFFDDLAASRDAYLDQDQVIESGLVPRFAKGTPTHLVYKEVRYHHVVPNLVDQDADLRVVALVRHPLAVLHSWWCAPKEFKPEEGWDLADVWRTAPQKNQGRPEEYFGFDRWRESTELFHRVAMQHPDRVRIVRYADLLADPVAVTRALFAWTGLDLASQTSTFIAESGTGGNEETYSVYRAKDDDLAWQGELPPDIVAAVERELRGTELERYLD